MRNIYEPPLRDNKTNLLPGVGKEGVLPSKRKNCIPYDAFVGDDDLNLEPKIGNLNPNLKKEIKKGTYVPRKVLQGGLSDEERSKLYQDREDFENILADQIDNPPDLEIETEDQNMEEQINGTNHENRGLSEISEANQFYPTEKIKIKEDYLEEIKDDPNLSDDQLFTKQSMKRQPVNKARYFRSNTTESHVTSHQTPKQVGRRINKELGTKFSEYQHQKHNEEKEGEVKPLDDIDMFSNIF